LIWQFKTNYIKGIFNILLVILFLYVAWLLKSFEKKPTLTITKEQSALNFDSSLLNIISIGQRRLLSDIFWISTLLESDINHVTDGAVNSWMFLRFKTISDLDPLFLTNYQLGGQYLAIVKDDIIGAEAILEKGLKYFPEDYKLNFQMGFLQTFELKSFHTAVSFFEKALQSDQAPSYLRSLVVKLKYKKTGDKELTLLLLKDMLESTIDERIILKLKSDINSVQTEVDLKCLNTTNKNCRSANYFGDKYIKKGNIFVAPKPYEKYDIYLR